MKYPRNTFLLARTSSLDIPNELAELGAKKKKHKIKHLNCTDYKEDWFIKIRSLGHLLAIRNFIGRDILITKAYINTPCILIQDNDNLKLNCEFKDEEEYGWVSFL